MPTPIRIAPAIPAADRARLGEHARAIERVLDRVPAMSVDPRFGGRTFIAAAVGGCDSLTARKS
jgi:pentose-5-phosphate-3-epimerase